MAGLGCKAVIQRPPEIGNRRAEFDGVRFFSKSILRLDYIVHFKRSFSLNLHYILKASI